MKMYLSKQDKSVKGLNDRGFTMLEMLFSFSIFCMVASFLPLMFNIMFHHQSIEGRLQEMEWGLFVNQLKKEIQASDYVNIVNGELTVINGEDTTTFQKYQNMLRRRVNGKGHEVVLQNVKEISFQHIGGGIQVRVINSFEQRNEVVIYPFVST